ncbi:hypothetical protein C1646_773060 [Rhizophagus diaphanus]|nr:hypothetical protein C1646_773060 [Rhizophagus diaphanus] [Rhizophagus sp. MUCL 43196]
MSSFNPIFQALIRIQSGKVNGVRYHPMFLRWAISVYSQAGNTAYEVMKDIMQLPLIAVKNIGNHGRIGFFSYDSFKEELQSFIIQSIYNFAYPQLVANLECIGIHTYRSVCDGAGENRNHIKSFDWWAYSWSLGDIVEVNIGKNNYEHVQVLISSELQVNCSSLRQPMPIKQNWNINDLCEFKSPKDNEWYTTIITNVDLEAQTFDITISSNKEGWKVAVVSQDINVQPLYDAQIH